LDLRYGHDLMGNLLTRRVDGELRAYLRASAGAGDAGHADAAAAHLPAARRARPRPQCLHRRTALCYGRQTATLDALGHLKISVVDAYGQLTEVREYMATYTLPLDWTALASNYYARTRYAYRCDCLSSR